ncbi:MAG: S8 family serine peptidase [Candidatus Omnitrophota bacterium]
MRSLNNRILLAAGIFIFFTGFAEAKTYIATDPATCTITVTLHKEFYIAPPEWIQKAIDELQRYRDATIQRIAELEQRVATLGEEYARALANVRGDPGVGASPQVQRSQEALSRAQESLARARSDLEWCDDELKNNQNALDDDPARRSGISDAEIQNKLADWKRETEAMWNGTTPYMYHCCQVRFVYEYIFAKHTDRSRRDYDQVALFLSPRFRSEVREFRSGFDRDGFSKDPFQHNMQASFSFYPDNGVIPHEAGHEIGLDDQYIDKKGPGGITYSESKPGHEHDLLAEPDGGTPFSTGDDGTVVDNIALILSKMEVTCPQTCCPQDAVPVPPTDATTGPGPIIVVDCVQGNIILKIYDASGRPVAVIYKQSLQINNHIIEDTIRRAKDMAAGQGSVSGPSVDPSQLNGNADSVMVLNKNVSDEEIAAIADKLKGSFERPGDCKKALDCTEHETGVDFIEPVKVRDVQAENENVTPNDPFYFDSSAHQAKKGAPAVLNRDFMREVAQTMVSVGKENDAKIHEQWGLHAVGFTPRSDPDSAWNLVDADKKNVVVAVIDSGLDVSHVDAPQYLWVNSKEVPGNGIDDDNNGFIDDVNGWNFLNENNDLTDNKGHGTFVTGIIAAKSNNAIAIAGINPGAQIMALKVGNEHGKASSFNIYRALHYAADHGARVINISLGSKDISKLEQYGVNYAYTKGCVIVVAAGNQSSSISEYGPPALHKVIAVAAAAPSGRRIWSSNIGANVALTAPGRSIYSLYSKDSVWSGPSARKIDLCYKADGTSFAAPFVTAVASLLLAKDPQLTNDEVEDILLASASDIEEPGWDQYTGAGFLDARAALAHPQGKILTVRFMDIVFNRKGKEVTSVDIYGVVRGDKARYTVELAKGTKSDKWEKVFESQTLPGKDGFICRIDAKKLMNGDEWTVRIMGEDSKKNSKSAKISFSL